MNNTTKKLQIEVRQLALSQLFRTHLYRGDLPISADVLVGFLTTDGLWDTGLGKLMMTSTVGSENSGRILAYGQSSEGDFISQFHAHVCLLPNHEILAHRGHAIYAKGGTLNVPSYGYAFQDVVWGMVKEPSDIRSALERALVLSASRPSQSDEPLRLLLPLYGSGGTILPIHDEDDRRRIARTFVYEQVQGLRASVRSLERPVHVTVTFQSDSIDWAALFKQSAKQAHLGDVAELTFSTTL